MKFSTAAKFVFLLIAGCCLVKPTATRAQTSTGCCKSTVGNCYARSPSDCPSVYVWLPFGSGQTQCADIAACNQAVTPGTGCCQASGGSSCSDNLTDSVCPPPSVFNVGKICSSITACQKTSTTTTPIPSSSSIKSTVTKDIEFTPEISIFGLLKAGETYTISSTSIADYIRIIFIAFVWIVGIIAVVMVIYGGIRWIAAAGNAGQINEARSIINNAIIGVIIALTSVVLLNIINPNLTSFKGLKLSHVEQESADYGPVYKSGPLPASISTFVLDTTTAGVTVHESDSIRVPLQKAFSEIKALGFPVNQVADFRPASKLCHGKGLAIDINPNQNYCVDCYGTKGAKVGSFYRPNDPAESSKDASSVTEQVVKIMKNNGFCWGGDWRSSKDYMHFSYNTCSASECAENGKFDFTKSVRDNQTKLGITYP